MGASSVCMSRSEGDRLSLRSGLCTSVSDEDDGVSWRAGPDEPLYASVDDEKAWAIFAQSIRVRHTTFSGQTSTRRTRDHD